ncbi:MAG: multifunctional CCA addition/repair protein [Granulosicoccus sp.]|nr:multifunctional CCA addition/repair protein [Granulosicoccus sp.]
MTVYLVGGAVRDKLLNLPVVDRDWVVVGSNTREMLAAGYKSVGKDFPVFLHPDSHEEYALARVERKTGSGYHGFQFSTDPSVTLEEDLSRRDLTINAIAQTVDGELVDPFGGKSDIDQRVLRHVSDAFVEDPVRVLRVARFMARFGHMGFRVADETLELMRGMVSGGEVDHLVAERVWQEMSRALLAQTPAAFFQTLRDCQALAVILPEVDALFGVPQPARWHPEIDCGIHTMMVLEQASLASRELDVRFAALCHDLGKATTPADILPSHTGHEKRGAVITRSLCERLRVPGKMRDLAILTARWHTHCHRCRELKAGTLVKLLQKMDVARKPARFDQYLEACAADARGRLGFEDCSYTQKEYLREAARHFRQVDEAAIARASSDKSAIAQNITDARVSAIRRWQDSSDR